MNFKTKSSLFLSGIVVLPLSVTMAQKTTPNVVLLIADDIGYGDIDWVEDISTVHTPNIKELSAQSLNFTNAHCTSATSTPSRYGLLTGMYPWRRNDTGIAPGDAAMIIKPHQHTIADMFKSKGYVTAAIGKWHLGLGGVAGEQDWNGTITPELKDIGFDYSFLMAATGDRVPCVYIENGRAVNLDPADPIQVSYKQNFPGEPTGKDNPELLRLHPSHGHDMALIDGISRIGYMKGGVAARWHDEDIADDITRKAVEFIKDNVENPFFLYFGTNDIHVPRMPHDRFKGKSGMGLRGDAILSFDYSVGEIIKTLRQLGIEDNTIFILTSDNGPVLDDGYQDQAVELIGNHTPSADFRGGKYSAFEAGTRIPFMVRWKEGGIQHGINDGLFSHIDLYASLAEIIGATIPPNEAPDSKNYADVLTGKSKENRKYLIVNNPSVTLSIIDDKGWKYIEPSNGAAYNRFTNIELGNTKEEQLYYLKTDIGEKNNLAKKKKKITERLKKILAEEKKKVSF